MTKKAVSVLNLDCTETNAVLEAKLSCCAYLVHLAVILNMLSLYYLQHGMRELVESGRYDIRNNFTVVLQPFFREVVLPRLEVRAGRFYQKSCFLTFFFSFIHFKILFTFYARMVGLIALISLLTVFISVRKLTPSWPGPFGTTW